MELEEVVWTRRWPSLLTIVGMSQRLDGTDSAATELSEAAAFPAPQQSLNFFPLPQGQGSFRPTLNGRGLYRGRDR